MKEDKYLLLRDEVFEVQTDLSVDALTVSAMMALWELVGREDSNAFWI